VGLAYLVDDDEKPHLKLSKSPTPTENGRKMTISRFLKEHTIYSIFAPAVHQPHLQNFLPQVWSQPTRSSPLLRSQGHFCGLASAEGSSHLRPQPSPAIFRFYDTRAASAAPYLRPNSCKCGYTSNQQLQLFLQVPIRFVNHRKSIRGPWDPVQSH